MPNFSDPPCMTKSYYRWYVKHRSIFNTSLINCPRDQVFSCFLEFWLVVVTPFFKKAVQLRAVIMSFFSVDQRKTQQTIMKMCLICNDLNTINYFALSHQCSCIWHYNYLNISISQFFVLFSGGLFLSNVYICCSRLWFCWFWIKVLCRSGRKSLTSQGHSSADGQSGYPVTS